MLLVHGAPSWTGSQASTVRASYERWGDGNATTVYCARWRGEPPPAPARRAARGLESARQERSGLDGKPLTKQAIPGRMAGNYYQHTADGSSSGSDAGAEPGQSTRRQGVEGLAVQRATEGPASARRNDTGGFFGVGDSASETQSTVLLSNLLSEHDYLYIRTKNICWLAGHWSLRRSFCCCVLHRIILETQPTSTISSTHPLSVITCCK